jgi:hypothetical protein
LGEPKKYGVLVDREQVEEKSRGEPKETEQVLGGILWTIWRGDVEWNG